jgi:medium-chain acyl-[acyl-carrier-protein] hydrolase
MGQRIQRASGDATVPTDDRWIYRRPCAGARLRLFCLPYAGGGASIYSRWQDDFPDDVEVCAVELPGRRKRLLEPPIRRVQPLVAAIVRGIEPCLDLPYALFGHSLGAIVAFELARELRRADLPGPQALFLSAAAAPHRSYANRPLWNLSDEEFLAEIRALGGVPEALLAEPELMSLFLPVLRADFEVLDSYAYVPDRPLDCPVELYGGEQDPRTSSTQLAAWRELFCGDVTGELFRGGHFYLNEERRALTSSIARMLRRVASGAPAAAPPQLTSVGAAR